MSQSTVVVACAVCFSGREETLWAYYITTAIMIGVPALLVGGFIFWYRRKLKNLADEATPVSDHGTS
ncbi:MAG: hypothetical protein GY786_13705 [Proteobacteria bacterium]|nr:hypothetical protein [Pseudomonadota bacterium]